MSDLDFQTNQIEVCNLFVLVTNRCNLVCKHCYVSSGPDGEFGLDFHDVKRLANQFSELRGRSVITLSGGEIFSRQGAVEFMEALQDMHDVFVLTNATLITGAKARRLRNARVAIRVGLDGATAISHDRMRGIGTYDRAMRGIHALLAAEWDPQRIELFFTVVDWNVGEIESILSLADSLMISKVHVEPVAVHGRALEHWPKTKSRGADELRQQYKIALQAALKSRMGEWQVVDRMNDFQSLTVYSDGRAFPYTPVDDVDEATGYLGNVLSDPLTSILEPSKYWRASMLKMMRHLRGKGQTAGQVRLARVGVSPGTVFQ